jgi:PBSX family phage terminase large subunit
MSLSVKQVDSIQRSTKHMNIWEGAVRSSKTWGTLFRWLKYVPTAPKEDLVMIGRTERSVVRNLIRPLQSLIGNECQWYPGRGEAYVFGRCHVVLGASDERAEGKVRGMTAGGALCDEITLWPESFWIMLLSRLSPDNAQLFGSTNPDNPYHYLKKDYLDQKKNLDLESFQFKLDDNPFISQKFKDNLKREYRGLWYKRFIEGLWVVAEGAIYDFFSEDEHVIVKPPAKAKSYVVGIDYGTGNPCVFGLFGINYDAMPFIWLEKEYYYDSQLAGRQKDDGEYADDLIKWLGNTNIDSIIIDPSAASFKATLRKKGLFVIRDADNDVLNGIRTQARLLCNGSYKICECCEHSIIDYSAYLWNKNSAKRGEDKPLKQHDHTKDMERYILHTLEGPDSINYARFNKR